VLVRQHLRREIVLQNKFLLRIGEKVAAGRMRCAPASVSSIQESRGEILAHFHGQILAGVGIKTSPVAQGFKIGQPDGKQLAALFLFLRLAGFADFGHHLFALVISKPLPALL
jgi:hypothetical protein